MTATQTLTYWFSSKLVPFTLSWQAWESKSMVSTHKVRVVRTLELPTLPVVDSVCTFLWQEGRGTLVATYVCVFEAKTLSDKPLERVSKNVGNLKQQAKSFTNIELLL